MHDNYWDYEKNVTSEIYSLGTQFYHRMKLFWSSCFDEKISMIAAPVQKLRFFSSKNWAIWPISAFFGIGIYIEKIQMWKYLSNKHRFCIFLSRIVFCIKFWYKIMYNSTILSIVSKSLKWPRNLTKTLKCVLYILIIKNAPKIGVKWLFLAHFSHFK